MREIRHKSGTVLTDGKSFVYLGVALEPNWTSMNNYGRKRTVYIFCTTYPKDLLVSDTKILDHHNRIDGLWLQEGYVLNNFKSINKKMINSDILEILEND